MDKMRLVEIAQVQGKITPLVLGNIPHCTERGLEADHPGKRFRADTDVAIEYPAQLARTDAMGEVSLNPVLTAFLVDHFQHMPQPGIGFPFLDRHLP